MADWKSNVQRDLLKNLVDELYKLEAENEELKKQNQPQGTNTGGTSTRHIDADEVEQIKRKIFGDVDRDDDR